MARFETAFEMTDGQSGFGNGCEALFDLGLRYSAGREVEVDLVEAHKWFNLAAARGHEAAKTYRAEIAADLSREDVARAQRMAREWLKAN